jgi:hypothetical protein
MSVLEALVEPTTRGDPDSPLRWTCKSVLLPQVAYEEEKKTTPMPEAASENRCQHRPMVLAFTTRDGRIRLGLQNSGGGVGAEQSLAFAAALGRRWRVACNSTGRRIAECHTHFTRKRSCLHLVKLLSWSGVRDPPLPTFLVSEIRLNFLANYRRFWRAWCGTLVGKIIVDDLRARGEL